jgi:hypothetical protein
MGCKVANFMLARQMKDPNTPPFFGLLSLPEADRSKAINETRSILRGRAETIPGFFRRYSYLSAWLITHTLNDAYGEDGQKVYALIEEILGVPIATQSERRQLHTAFQTICEKAGLPSRGFDRMVDLYLLHAGVSKAQLPHLIAAFVRQHAVYGVPPTETSFLLNRWEDDALEFLHPTVITPRRAILWDETAWHAALYARIAEAPDTFQPKGDYEEAFYRHFCEAKASQRHATTAAILPPRPRLHWGKDGLVLRLPRVEGRIAVWLDGAPRPLRLKGGEDWLLEQPWPKQMRAELDGHSFSLSFLCPESAFAAFDMTAGNLVAEVPVRAKDIIQLDSSDAMIAARRPFEVEGVEAFALGEDCFVLRTAFAAQAKDLVMVGNRFALSRKPRRRLFLAGGEIASGPNGKLFGPEAMVHVETGLETSEDREVCFSLGDHSWHESVPIEAGSGAIPIGQCLSADLPADPQRLRLDLMTPSVAGDASRPSGISLEAWVWPGYKHIDGITIHASPAPRNFLADQSSHVTLSHQGLLLDAEGGYAEATVAFDSDGEPVCFCFPWPDISVLRYRADGTASPVHVGARISVGADDRFGHISIRCPDREASLIVGDRFEALPFALGMTRNIAISDLLDNGGKSAVVLKRSTGAEAVLFELVNLLEPSRFTVRPSRSGIEITIELGTAIDAIGIEVEDEFGRREFHEISLGRWPARKPAPPWLRAWISGATANEAKVQIAQTDAVNGLRIGRILIRPDSPRPDESWRPLRNRRGDTYAVPLSTHHSITDAPKEHLKARFEILSRWMSDCYAQECWSELKRTLARRWYDLGETIATLPLGAGILIGATLAPPPDETSTSWVPLAHPVEIAPNLYGARPEAFLSLANQSDDGLRAGAKLLALSHQDLRAGLLHGQALMSFRNSRQAQAEGVQLQGFDPRSFLKLYPIFDTNAAAGWFWQGAPLLGPDHLRAAFQHYVERLEAAQVFVGEEPENGSNSLRREALRTLVMQVWSRTEAEFRPTVPKRHKDDERPFQIDLWVAATLSEFARASRFEMVEHFTATLSAELSRHDRDVLASLGFLLRLAPELFFFYLLMWHLAKVRP